MVANAKGNADMTGVINNVPAIPSSGWYVSVHYIAKPLVAKTLYVYCSGASRCSPLAESA